MTIEADQRPFPLVTEFGGLDELPGTTPSSSARSCCGGPPRSSHPSAVVYVLAPGDRVVVHDLKRAY